MTISPKYLLKLLVAVFAVALVNTSQLDAMKRKGGPLYPPAKRQCLGHTKSSTLGPNDLLAVIRNAHNADYPENDIVAMVQHWLRDEQKALSTLRNSTGQTVLHLACAEGGWLASSYVRIILLAAGFYADTLINLRDSMHQTAFDKAPDNWDVTNVLISFLNS